MSDFSSNPSNPLPLLRSDNFTVTVTKTRPADTTTYAVDDAVSESTSAGTVWTFANMARNPGEGGMLQGLDLIISTAQSLKFDGELWLFDTAPASGLNDNAAWTPTDAELKTKVCILSFNGGSWRTGSGNGSIELPGLAVSYQCAAGSTSLYGVMRAKNAYIPTSAEDFTVRAHVIRD